MSNFSSRRDNLKEFGYKITQVGKEILNGKTYTGDNINACGVPLVKALGSTVETLFNNVKKDTKRLQNNFTNEVRHNNKKLVESILSNPLRNS